MSRGQQTEFCSCKFIQSKYWSMIIKLLIKLLTKPPHAFGSYLAKKCDTEEVVEKELQVWL